MEILRRPFRLPSYSMLTQGSGRFASCTLGCTASRFQRLKCMRLFTTHAVK
jgi:hypothetical protein